MRVWCISINNSQTETLSAAPSEDDPAWARNKSLVFSASKSDFLSGSRHIRQNNEEDQEEGQKSYIRLKILEHKLIAHSSITVNKIYNNRNLDEV